MGMFDFFRKDKKSNVQTEERQISVGGLSFNSLSTFSKDKSLTISAVYCAVNQISNAVALLPIDIEEYADGAKVKLQHPLGKVLNYKPNEKYTHYDFFKQIMESVLLRGNGYALIERDDRLNVKKLVYIDSSYVTPMVQKDGTVKYLVAGMNKAVDASDMLDFHMHLDSNYNGISVLYYAYLTLQGSSDASSHAENFFKSGANLSGVLKSSSPMTNEQKKQLLESWKGSFQSSSSKVPVAVLPAGIDFEAISISPKDSLLIDYFQWSVIEIARFFCIPPSKLMVWDDVSYNSLEYAQLNFMQDTVLPYTKMMESEMNAKLFPPSKVGKTIISFDYSTLMSANKETEANYYKTLLVNGIMTPNEVRSKLGLSPMDGEVGDKHYCQISYGTMEDIASGRYIKQNAQSQNVNIDNKVKQSE